MCYCPASYADCLLGMDIMNELLERIGWTRRHFSGMVGVDEKTVGRWCSGAENSVAMAYLRMVSKVLGV